MRALVLIPCTDRKRFQPEDSLRARSLSYGNVCDVAREWGERVGQARELQRPDEVYCGRAFKEARDAATELSAEMAVVSAGLGLVRQFDKIPSYSLTVSNGRADSVGRRIDCPDWSAEHWWRALGSQTSALTNLTDLLGDAQPSLVLFSLSESYARMLSWELASLNGDALKNLRIFGAGISSSLPTEVAKMVMPYDARLNGTGSPAPGTMSDFSSRALRHYTQCLLNGFIDGSNADADRDALSEIMVDWSMPETPKRTRLSDDQVINFILENWNATGGRSGVTLKLLRTSGLACEQGRFKGLFHRARNLHEGAKVKFA